MTRSQPVYEATKAYVIAALRYLEEHHGPGPTSVLEWEHWVRTEPRQFVRQHFLEERWSPIYGRIDEEIHSLLEYGECLAAMRGDGVIGRHLETLVGTVVGAHRVELHAIPDGILSRLATEVRGWDFDEARFDALYGEYESALFAESFTYNLVVPLPGLTSDGLPIDLGEQAVVDTMTEEEALACVRSGLFQPMGGDWPIISVASETALRLTVSLPKVVGEPRPEARDQEVAALFDRFKDVAERTVLALRLSSSSRIVAPGYIYYANEWPLRGAISFAPLGSSPRRTMWATAYEVDAEAVAAFRESWGQLASEGVRRQRELGVALRRFSDAGDRDRDDDALIDLMIAAEAMFLPNVRDELKYRLALRAAFFIAAEMGLSRREVFSHMKRAYDARSVLAHGGVLADLKLADGTHVALGEFVRVTTDHLRTALRKGVRLASESAEARPLVDWDNLTLGEA